MEEQFKNLNDRMHDRMTSQETSMATLGAAVGQQQAKLEQVDQTVLNNTKVMEEGKTQMDRMEALLSALAARGDEPERKAQKMTN